MVYKTAQAKTAMVHLSSSTHSTLQVRIPCYMMTYCMPSIKISFSKQEMNSMHILSRHLVWNFQIFLMLLRIYHWVTNSN